MRSLGSEGSFKGQDPRTVRSVDRFSEPRCVRGNDWQRLPPKKVNEFNCGVLTSLNKITSVSEKEIRCGHAEQRHFGSKSFPAPINATGSLERKYITLLINSFCS